MNAGYPTMLLIPGMSAFQRVNEPASGLAGRMFFQVHCPHGKTGPDVGLHLHVQRNPFSRCEIFLDHWQRHIPPRPWSWRLSSTFALPRFSRVPLKVNYSSISVTKIIVHRWNS